MKKQASLFVLVLILLISVSCGGEKDQVTAQVMKMATETISKQCKIVKVEVESGATTVDSDQNTSEFQSTDGEVVYVASIFLDCGGNKINLVAPVKQIKGTGELDYTEVTNILKLYSD